MALGNKGGRPRKPTALKVVQGTFKPHRHNFDEPQPPPASLDPPKFLTQMERRHWQEVAPMLAQIHVLTAADRTALARYCVLLRLFIATKRALKKSPTALDALLKINVQLKSIETEFGLSPASRSRINAKPPQTDDEENKKEKRFFG